MSSNHTIMLSLDSRTLTTDLDRAGYREVGIFVRIAADFDTAQKILAKESIDVVVINMDFEAVDGLQVCKFLKQNAKTKDIPVVLTSVQSSATTRTKALEAGADLFVEQPIPRQSFIERIKTLLDQSTRTNDRVEFGGQATCESGDRKLSAHIEDLSASGILLATDALDIGDQVDMSFAIPGSKRAIKVRGEVVRKVAAQGDTPSGTGIRFVTFQGDGEQRLQRYVERTHDETRMIYYL